MKRFLFFLPFFFLLLPAAAASAEDFQTPEYDTLQTLVGELESESNEPASEADRERAWSALNVAYVSASWSIDMVRQAQETRLEARLEIGLLNLQHKTEKALQSAKMKVHAWYKKNKARPRARQKAARMLLRAETRIGKRFESQQRALFGASDQELEETALRHELQQTRAQALLERGGRAIDSRPEIV